jgi:hypothetical protein
VFLFYFLKWLVKTNFEETQLTKNLLTTFGCRTTAIYFYNSIVIIKTLFCNAKLIFILFYNFIFVKRYGFRDVSHRLSWCPLIQVWCMYIRLIFLWTFIWFYFCLHWPLIILNKFLWSDVSVILIALRYINKDFQCVNRHTLLFLSSCLTIIYPWIIYFNDKFERRTTILICLNFLYKSWSRKLSL